MIVIKTCLSAALASLSMVVIGAPTFTGKVTCTPYAHGNLYLVSYNGSQTPLTLTSGGSTQEVETYTDRTAVPTVFEALTCNARTPDV